MMSRLFGCRDSAVREPRLSGIHELPARDYLQII
jgi:hypothetical protein